MNEQDESKTGEIIKTDICEQKLIRAIQALSDLKETLSATPGKHQPFMDSFVGQVQEFASIAERLYNKSQIDQRKGEECEELPHSSSLSPAQSGTEDPYAVELQVSVKVGTPESALAALKDSPWFELWQGLEGFEFDTADVPKPFSRQLMEKYFWSEKYTRQQIEGFRQFIFIYAAYNIAAPPPEMDKVFHAVLLDTQLNNKLEDLIEKQLNHIPDDGSAEQKEAILNAYANTYYLVSKFFGEPDPRVWPKGYDAIHV